MTRPASLLRRLTSALMRIATQLLPTRRSDWAKAMHAELDQFENDRDALVWAIGCVVAGVKERVSAVFINDLKISRWILAPEMLLCFVPLTIAWLDGIGGVSGIVRLNTDVIQQYFIGVPGGLLALFGMFIGVILATLGPIGLIVSFRLIVLGRPTRSQWVRAALVTGPILNGVLTIVFRWLVGGSEVFSFKSAAAFDVWSGLLLLSALPALGAAHMLRLGRTGRDEGLAC
jgi:hypothetical protein